MAKVQKHLPRFSGDRLDLVIDYVTYVFVPALALLQAGFLRGGFGVLLASLILLSSLFHFADTESKADDHSFVGFPAIWNAVAFYVFAFGLSQAATAALVLACVVLTFVPLKWAHPMRTPLLWPVTVALSGAVAAGGGLGGVVGLPGRPVGKGGPAAGRHLRGRPRGLRRPRTLGARKFLGSGHERPSPCGHVPEVAEGISACAAG